MKLSIETLDQCYVQINLREDPILQETLFARIQKCARGPAAIRKEKEHKTEK